MAGLYLPGGLAPRTIRTCCHTAQRDKPRVSLPGRVARPLRERSSLSTSDGGRPETPGGPGFGSTAALRPGEPQGGDFTGE